VHPPDGRWGTNCVPPGKPFRALEGGVPIKPNVARETKRIKQASSLRPLVLSTAVYVNEFDSEQGQATVGFGSDPHASHGGSVLVSAYGFWSGSDSPF
jgi:hypothetical protein